MAVAGIFLFLFFLHLAALCANWAMLSENKTKQQQKNLLECDHLFKLSNYTWPGKQALGSQIRSSPASYSQEKWPQLPGLDICPCSSSPQFFTKLPPLSSVPYQPNFNPPPPSCHPGDGHHFSSGKLFSSRIIVPGFYGIGKHT